MICFLSKGYLCAKSAGRAECESALFPNHSFVFRGRKDVDEAITHSVGRETWPAVLCTSLNILLPVLQNRERMALWDLDSCFDSHKDTRVQSMRSAKRLHYDTQLEWKHQRKKQFQFEMSQPERDDASLTFNPDVLFMTPHESYLESFYKYNFLYT